MYSFTALRGLMVINVPSRTPLTRTSASSEATSIPSERGQSMTPPPSPNPCQLKKHTMHAMSLLNAHRSRIIVKVYKQNQGHGFLEESSLPACMQYLFLNLLHCVLHPRTSFYTHASEMSMTLSWHASILCFEDQRSVTNVKLNGST